MGDRFTAAGGLIGTRGGRRALLACTGAVLIAICLVFATVMAAWHGDVGKALGASGQGVASAVAQEVDRDIEILDVSVRAVAQQWGRREIRELSPHLRDMVLFDDAMRAPGFGMVLVIDAAGRVLAGSTDGWSAATRLDDRDYFKVHVASEVGLFVSKPFVSRLSGRPSVALSRRIDDDAGRFAGVVAGTIDLDYLSRLYAGLTLGTGSAVALLRMDGTVIAREPPMAADAPGWIGDRDGFTRMRSAQSGTFEGVSPFDGRHGITSFHRVGDLPLIQAMEVGEDGAYATWWRRAAAVAGLLTVLCLCVMGLCLALTRELARRVAAEATLSRLAGTDPLTGLANRRSFDVALAAEWSTAAAEPVSLLMVDADAFKAYNDLFGHQAGDDVLRRVARCLEAFAHERGGVACRWGGEEFALLLRGPSEPEAAEVADELCRSVRGLGLEHPRGVGGVVTVSVGVASTRPSDGGTAQALLADADAALYRAKAEGRDRSRRRLDFAPTPSRDKRLGSLV
jgi:diguanylate cyclase (GGDEF)-like protein